MEFEGAKIDDAIHEGVATCQNMLSQCTRETTKATLQSAFFITQYTKDNINLLKFSEEQMHLLSLAMNESIVKGTRGAGRVLDTATKTVIDEVTN